MERKLASIQRVLAVKKHPNADTLDLITVLGWQVVSKSGQLKEGDMCVFFEIDSILPKVEAFAFMERVNYRVKTCKLRGEISQGLVMPTTIFNEAPLIGDPNKYPAEEGTDVTELLGVVKYEPKLHKSLATTAKGNFPSFLRKTDALRFQGLKRSVIEDFDGEVFVASLKVDGSSFTAYLNQDDFGICSRNLDLKLDGEDKSSAFHVVAKKYDLENLLRNFVKDNKWGIKNIAVQAELVGPTIQKNPLGLKEYELRVFDIFNIDKYEYVWYDVEMEITKTLNLPHVEILTDVLVFDHNKHTVDYFLEKAKGVYDGTDDNPIEGIVFKSIFNKPSIKLGDRMKFKVINNEYLLKTERKR